MVNNIFKNLMLFSFGGLVLCNAALHYIDYTKQKNIVKEVKYNQDLVKHIGSQLPKILPKYELETLLDKEYDQNNFLMNNPILNSEESMNFNEVVKSLYDIVSVGRYKSENGEEFKVHKFAKSVAWNDKKDEPYFFTVEHVAQLAKVMDYPFDDGKPKTQCTLQKTEHFLMIDPENGKQYEIGRNMSEFSLFKLEEVLSNYRLDMALLHIPKKDLPDSVNINFFPYGIGRNSELNYGDMVYLIGNPFHKGINIREGIVSMREAQENNFRGAPNKYFTTSVPVSPGDSGNLFIALRDGKPELVGLAQSVHKDNMCISTVLGIDAIMEEIGNAGITSLYESMQDKMFN
ncbi:MAG: S1C family serine protease [Nanoarchaeota archaeon]|nr:S1C family serine protease [Nanoarchaeota archaeon]